MFIYIYMYIYLYIYTGNKPGWTKRVGERPTLGSELTCCKIRETKSIT